MLSSTTLKFINSQFFLTTIGSLVNTTNLDFRVELTLIKYSKAHSLQFLTRLTKRSFRQHSMDFSNKINFLTQQRLFHASMMPLLTKSSFSLEKYSKKLPRAQFLISWALSTWSKVSVTRFLNLSKTAFQETNNSKLSVTSMELLPLPTPQSLRRKWLPTWLFTICKSTDGLGILTTTGKQANPMKSVLLLQDTVIKFWASVLNKSLNSDPNDDELAYFKVCIKSNPYFYPLRYAKYSTSYSSVSLLSLLIECTCTLLSRPFSIFFIISDCITF